MGYGPSTGEVNLERVVPPEPTIKKRTHVRGTFQSQIGANHDDEACAEAMRPGAGWHGVRGRNRRAGAAVTGAAARAPGEAYASNIK